MMLLQRVEISAFGPLRLDRPLELRGPVTCVTGPPASGRTSLLRALSLLGGDVNPDPVLDYPRSVYPSVRSGHDWLPALRATLLRDEDPFDVEIPFGRSNSGACSSHLPVAFLPDALDPAPLLRSELLESGRSPEEIRIGREFLSASLSSDLSAYASRPVRVTIDQGPNEGALEVRIHDPEGPYSVPVERAGRGLSSLLVMLTFAASLADSEPSLVLIDDLGSGVHPFLGPGILDLIHARIASRHQVVYTTVHPSFVPTDPQFVFELPDPIGVLRDPMVAGLLARVPAPAPPAIPATDRDQLALAAPLPVPSAVPDVSDVHPDLDPSPLSSDGSLSDFLPPTDPSFVDEDALPPDQDPELLSLLRVASGLPLEDSPDGVLDPDLSPLPLEDPDFILDPDPDFLDPLDDPGAPPPVLEGVEEFPPSSRPDDELLALLDSPVVPDPLDDASSLVPDLDLGEDDLLGPLPSAPLPDFDSEVTDPVLHDSSGSDPRPVMDPPAPPLPVLVPDPDLSLDDVSRHIDQLLSSHYVPGRVSDFPEDRVDLDRYLRALDESMFIPISSAEIDPSRGVVASIESVVGSYDRIEVAESFLRIYARQDSMDT